MRVRWQVLIILVAVLGSGACARLHPEFEQSNQVILEQTLGEADLATLLRNRIPEGATVALISYGFDDQQAELQLASVEDPLTQQLVGAGFNVVERNQRPTTTTEPTSPTNLPQQPPHLIIHLPPDPSLLHVEHNNTDPKDRRDKDKKSETASPASSPSLPSEHRIVIDQPSPPDDYPTRSWELLRKQNPKVDYFIAYRVQEFGVLYRDDARQTDHRTREARARLHIRVINADTQQVIAVNTLDASSRDEVHQDLARSLTDYHYNDYYFEYPGIDHRHNTLLETLEAVTVSERRVIVAANILTIPAPLVSLGYDTHTGVIAAEAIFATDAAFGLSYMYSHPLTQRVPVFFSFGVSANIGGFANSAPNFRAGPRVGLEWIPFDWLAIFTGYNVGLTLVDSYDSEKPEDNPDLDQDLSGFLFGLNLRM